MDGEEWSNVGESNTFRYETINAVRGNIFSSKGNLLATSLPIYKLCFDPTVVDGEILENNIDTLSQLLAGYLRRNPPKYYRDLILQARKRDNRYIVLSNKKIDYRDKQLIEQWPVFNLGRMKGGIIFEKVNERFQPYSYLGHRTIGSVDNNNRGVVGLEYSFNHFLAGQNGKALYEKMIGGGWKPIYDGSTTVRPKPGYDVETTLDIDLQDIASQALLEALAEHDADYGSLVLMEVKTGEIKAIANLSKNSRGFYAERYNYAVGSQGSREPGSTFKLVSMLALMEVAGVKLTDTIDTGNGSFEFYDRVMRDHKPDGFGTLTVQEIFEKSSNIGIARLVAKHFGSRPEAYVNFIKSLQIGKPLGFQLVGEGEPYIKEPSDSSWSGVTLPWMSHGYEVKLTPLQTLSIFNAVANNGKMIQPLLVKRIKEADKEIQEFQPKVLNKKICSEQTLTKARLLLEGVVEKGTARNIRSDNYKIAGKTGTAMKLRNGKYINEYYTSFVGYFPAEAPKYSCIVVIDNPKGYKIYGSLVAAPVFKKLADNVYAKDIELHDPSVPEVAAISDGVFPVIRSGYYEDLSFISNQLGISNHLESKAVWVQTKIVGNSILWKPNKVDNNEVPDVRGMTFRDALFLLENLGLEVEAKGIGRVVKQSLYPGQNFKSGYTIKLELG